jgi:pectinesterase
MGMPLLDDQMNRKSRSRVFAIASILCMSFASLADVQLTVNKAGGAQYTTVQAAVDAVPTSSSDRYVINIAPGTYTEIIRVPANKLITFSGTDAASTIITNNLGPGDGANEKWGHATTAVMATNFIARNITFRNTKGQNGGQALAMYVDADRAIFDSCRFIGWQDTLRPERSRSFFKDCYIEGHVDFIYGKGQAYFERCTTNSLAGGYVTAQGREGAAETNGFVFHDCTITGTTANNSVTLGRPWQAYARVIYDRCAIGPIISSTGWTDLSGAGSGGTAYFAEYQSKNLSGALLNISGRVSWSHQLTAQEVAAYSMENWTKGTDNWNPIAELPEPTSLSALFIGCAAVLRRRRSIRIAAAMSATAVLSANAIPAFPGATGPGANATGGRGGDVYHVTRLDTDLTGATPGTLMYGFNTAPAAGRTIVFDVGGTIFQNGGGPNAWYRVGKSNVTIAGQTAPGTGITIAGTGTKWTGNNVILRNITARTNKDPSNPANYTYDAFSLQTTNSMIDHVTASWFSDEGISITDAGQNSTVQYANISEGLNYQSHAFGSIIATEVDATHYSFRHNLYAQNTTRIPRLGSELGATGAVTDFSNNVIYNWINKAGYSGTNQNSSTNFINNYYIKGNNNGATLFSGGDDAAAPGYTKIYQSGNVYDGNKDGVFNGAAVGAGSFAGNKTIVGTPFTVSGVLAVDSPALALQRVLDYGGANWQNRNPIDQRMFADVRAGTGSIITDLTTGVQATEWATVLSQQATGGVAPFVRPANYDTDNDGMPNAWEQAYGLNTSVADYNGDFDSDGYRNIEEYINDLSAWPAPSTLVFTNANGTGRYAEIGNWGNVWQPSRFDAAQLNSGTITVDAPGQQSRSLVVAANSGNNATLRVTSGWIDVRESLAVGSAGSGTVTQSGGLVRAGTSITLGSASQPGVYQLTGGTLATPLLAKGNAASVFELTGGVLHANTIAFGLVNQGGTIAPGSDASLQAIATASMSDINGTTEPVLPIVGSTHVVGSLVMASGTAQIDVSSSAAFDTIVVDGALSLGGNLAIVTNPGYDPAYGQTHTILTGGSVSGAFSTVSGFSQSSQKSWLVTTLPASVQLSTVIPGDANLDYKVNTLDFNILAGKFGQANQGWSGADFNYDNVTNSIDFTTLVSTFGMSAPPPSAMNGASVVPEPLALGAITPLLLFRRRRVR